MCINRIVALRCSMSNREASALVLSTPCSLWNVRLGNSIPVSSTSGNEPRLMFGSSFHFVSHFIFLTAVSKIERSMLATGIPLGLVLLFKCNCLKKICATEIIQTCCVQSVQDVFFMPQEICPSKLLGNSGKQLKTVEFTVDEFSTHLRSHRIYGFQKE